VRIWDVPVRCLCRSHLLAEHRELHAIWNVITLGKRGYANHPETLRWRGHLPALAKRHKEQVREMLRRGWRHDSPLPAVRGAPGRPRLLLSLYAQRELLRAKGCSCLAREPRPGK
jgi:hypothetical protein